MPDPSPPATPPILRTLAGHVRNLRRAHGLSRAALAERSGLSERYLARVESAEGNISVLRLEAIARALGTHPASLLRALPGDRPLRVLVGMRGAGKSTVGPRVASALGLPFRELDALVVDEGGLPVDQVFDLHGPRFYRRLERAAVRRLVAERAPVVLAAAGGIVNDDATWERLLDEATVVWLRATPEDHWNRVVAQGDRRPMADNPQAMEELRSILRAREPLYRQAHATVDTHGAEVDVVVGRVVETLDELERRSRQGSGGANISM